jgi:hypothetical protein
VVPGDGRLLVPEENGDEASAVLAERVWTARTLAEVVRAVVAAFEVSEREARHDVERFVVGVEKELEQMVPAPKCQTQFFRALRLRFGASAKE